MYDDTQFRCRSASMGVLSSQATDWLTYFNIRNTITFDNPDQSGSSSAPYRERIVMSRSCLNPASEAQELRCAGVLAQELWHTQQSRYDRYSVWGELDAFNFEIRVREEIGATPMGGGTDNATIKALGNPGETPRDMDSLCVSRHALPDFWLYNSEPLVYVYAPDGLINVLPILQSACPF